VIGDFGEGTHVVRNVAGNHGGTNLQTFIVQAIGSVGRRLEGHGGWREGGKRGIPLGNQRTEQRTRVRYSIHSDLDFPRQPHEMLSFQD